MRSFTRETGPAPRTLPSERELEGWAAFSMTDEETQLLQRERTSHIRLIKRLMRPLPRRANIHRYPGLKWFAVAARKRAYLWSFRTSEVIPALYAGCILTFLPLYGVQFAIAAALALLLKANLPVIIGLQFVSNPLTVPFIYKTAHEIGKFFLLTFGDPSELSDVAAIAQTMNEPGLLAMGVRSFVRMMIGGAVIGYFAGFFSSLVYSYGARRIARTHARLKILLEERRRLQAEAAAAVKAAPETAPHPPPPGKERPLPETPPHAAR